MSLRTLITFFILLLIAGVGFAVELSPKKSNAVLPECRDQTQVTNASSVNLSAKTVLVLHDFQANMPLNLKVDQGIRQKLEIAGLGVKNQFYEYLDLTDNPGTEHMHHLVELLRLRYASRKIDVLITLEQAPLEFLLNECRGLFIDAPVLALDLPPSLVLPETDRHIVLQSIDYDMAGTLEEAMVLVPKAKRVYVVIGAFPEYQPYIDQARRDFTKWEGQLEFIYLNDKSFEDILAMASGAPSGTIVLYLVMIQDISGKVYNPRDAARQLCQVSTAPVFGLYDTLLGHGIVGGSMVSYEQLGTQAAKIALEILTNPNSLEGSKELLDVPNMPMFDFRQLRHWKLNEGALPEECIVINRPPSLWDYKYHVIGGLSFILGQSFLIFGLLIQKRRRRNAEKSLQQKSEELDNFFKVNLDLLCIADTNGYFLRLNPAWEKSLGFRLTELMSRRFMEFVHPDDADATVKALQTLASSEKVVGFTNRYRTKDGSYRHLLWSAVAIDNRIFAAARDVTEHSQAEKVIHERGKELQVLTGRLILNREEESRRLARELHDDLSQRLAVLAIEAGKMEASARGGCNALHNPLIEFRDKTIQIAADVQNISRRLHPSILEDLGLTKAIEAECQQFAKREGVEMCTPVQNLPKNLPMDIALSIYRIVQESLMNIAKHACARCVTVSLNANATGLHLMIGDDGIGFDAQEVRNKAGLGLSSIRERVRLIQGTHRIRSEPEKGTTVEVLIPYNPVAPADTHPPISKRTS